MSLRERRAEARIKRELKAMLHRMEATREPAVSHKAAVVAGSDVYLEMLIDKLLDVYEPLYKGPLADFAKSIMQWLAENPDIWIPILIDLLL